MLRQITFWCLLAPALLLGGCTWTRDMLKGDRIDYKTEGGAKAGATPTLELPPDLTQPTASDRYKIPTDGSTKRTESLSDVSKATPANLPSGVLPTVANARIERGGSQRWLVVSGKPDQYWQTIKEFWQELGFVISIERPETGVMETDWAENRAQIRKDLLGRTMGSLLDGVYSTPERDKFRTRLETNANGETEIYISHRGMVEIYKTEAREQTTWQERPADPGLEADFLRRLMVRLGTDEKVAITSVNRPDAPPERARIEKNGNASVVVMDEVFDRAWRRVGLALDRVGFTVEDRDRSKGLFFVRYADPDVGAKKKQEGFFSKFTNWFNTDKTPPAEQYQIQVTDAAPATRVTVLSKAGTPENSQTSQRILSLLHEQLK